MYSASLGPARSCKCAPKQEHLPPIMNRSYAASHSSTADLPASSSASSSAPDAPQSSLPPLPELLQGRMSTAMLDVWASLQKVDQQIIREIAMKQLEVYGLREDVTKWIEGKGMQKTLSKTR